MRKEAKSKDSSGLTLILLRYISCLLLSFNSLFIWYFIFTPVTIYLVYFLFNLFFYVSLQGSTIFIGNYAIELVKACIAGSAYFLLFILNFTTPMNTKKRIFSLLFSFLALLVINIIRIFIFSILFITNFYLFDELHLFFWYFISGILVFFVWLLEIKIFKIKTIPVYSDLKKILGIISLKKKKK